MTTDETINSMPPRRSGPLLTGAALFAAGGLIALAGIAIGSGHVVAASRRWIQAMEVPPSELAKLKLAQARAAALAGAGAWRTESAKRAAGS
jgi:cell division protein FtsW (lipid II flippase)